MENFKVGDVVQLKSGGIKMTISGILAQNLIECVYYYEATGLFKYINLLKDTLKTVANTERKKTSNTL